MRPRPRNCELRVAGSFRYACWGVWDVHRYLTADLSHRRMIIDVTFPREPAWDGASLMPVACGPGTDYPDGRDPDADKRALEAAHCDPLVREPFIAALTRL